MRSLFENLPLKAASLAAAVVLWFVIAGEKTSERGMAAPVELQNFPKDLELVSGTVSTVEVRLRASPGIIHALAPGDVSAQINLAGSHEGERIIHLTPESIRVPFGVRVVKIAPSILTLSFDRTLEKAVPVRPRLVGTPAAGFEVATVTSTPASVQIDGPRGRVESVESAFTEPISVEGAADSVSAAVSVGLPDPLLRLLGNPVVNVNVRVAEARQERAFEGLLVEIRGGSALARPAHVRLVVAGTAAALAALSESALHPYVTLVAGPPGEPQRARVSVDLPPGLSAAGIDPVELTLRPSNKRNPPQ